MYRLTYVIFPALLSFVVGAQSLFAQELLTSRDAKEAFLAQLSQSISQAERALGAYQQQITRLAPQVQAMGREFQALQAKVRAGGPFDGNENQRGVELLESLLCDVRIMIPMGIRRLDYDKGWTDYLTWAKAIRQTLFADPTDNPYLWYGRYDFAAGIRLYQQYIAALYEGRRQLIENVCQMLRRDFFRRLREVSAKMDANNVRGEELQEQTRAANQIEDEERRNAVLNRIREEAERIREQQRRLKDASDRLVGPIRQAWERRTLELRYEMNQLLRKLAALAVPARGKITRTHPGRIRFGNRPIFGVTFLGQKIPLGLQPSDIELPPGLVLLDLSGGGNRLYMHLRKTDALTAGRHTIKIAGESVPFTFEAANEDDPSIRAPLLQRSASLPTGSGQVPADGKGTFLTPEALMDYPQEQRGYWQVKRENDQEEASPPYHFDSFRDDAGKDWFLLKGLGFEPDTFDNLQAHQRMARTEIQRKGVVGQYDQVQGMCHSGLRSTREVPRPDGTEVCPAWRWWEPARLCFGPRNLEAKEVIDGRRHDDGTCETTDQPGPIDVTYERFVGLTFAPLQPGKYIHTLTVVTPGAYRLSVSLQWDYTPIKPGRIAFTIRRLTDNAVLKEVADAPVSNVREGGYLFTVDQPGKYGFEMRVFNAAGKLIHRDMAAAYLGH